MKKIGFFILFGGIFLIIFILHIITSSGLPKREYRKGSRVDYQYVYNDTVKTPLSEFRKTNYLINPKPIYTYDEDGELEVEYEDYDRSYYGSDYSGGSYSGGK